MELPIEFVKSIKDIVPQYDDFLEVLNQGYYKGVRINTLKCADNYIFNIMGKNHVNVKWYENGFYLGDMDTVKDPFYFAGMYYIQEPSAMLPAAIIPIGEDECVLDLCAAPGGKSTLLGERMNGSGLLVVNDISTSRCPPLLKNLERHGITNYVILNEESGKLAGVFGEFFDKILIDAPCSGEGMFRKDAKAVKSWLEKGPECYKGIQQKLLFDAAKMLKPGGMLAYSTCTFNTTENEDNISFFLEQHDDFVPVFLDHEGLGISKGLKGLDFCGRIWPHIQKGEGHFTALLQKKGKPVKDKKRMPAYENKRKELFPAQEFIEENLKILPGGILTIFRNSVMLINDSVPDLSGIRVFRSGMDFGSIERNRFEPGQALAMSLTPNQVKNSVSFDKDDIRINKYIKGESLDFDGQAGWYLVCVEGYPLGFGKCDGKRLKNKINTGWIR